MSNPPQGRMQRAPTGLGHLRQFILCKLVPSQRKPGKFDKVPCNQYGVEIDAMNPANWRTWDECMHYVMYNPVLYIGFVITPPYFFADLDDAYNSITGWSGLAMGELARFQGAYTEVSQSGTGLHFIGRGSLPEGHQTRRAGHPVELYTRDRWVLITGTHAQGNADAGFDLVPFMQHHGLRIEAQALSLEAGRDPAWSGPEDDNELIAYALNQRPTQNQMFGSALTFKECWLYDTEAFKRKQGGDHSAVDFSLMSHLSFFTGRDEERMLRLFQRWQGYRPEKYDRRAALLSTMVRKGTTNPQVLQARKPALPVPTTTGVRSFGGLFSGSTIQGMDFKPLQYLVDDFIPMGCWLMVGKPKRGKTWMMLDLAIAVASGGEFMGHSCIKGKVLYLALEENKRRLKARLDTLCAARNAWGAPGNILFAANDDDIPNADGGLYEMIAGILDEHPDIRLVILDTLHKVRPAPRNGENVYSYDRRCIDPLTDMLSHRPELSMMIVHHTRKSKSDDPYEMASGSNGLTGAADGHIFLGNDEQGQTVFYMQGRDAESCELAVKLEGCVWEIIGDAEVAGMSDIRVKIIEEMRKHAMGVGPSDIAKAINEPAVNVRNRLKAMAKANLVTTETYGKWVLTPHALSLGRA